MKSKPIGIFDSGVGGLTVVREIVKVLPNEDIVYLGDTARVPYGIRSKSTVSRFAKEDVNFLLRKNVKCIVIACNTVVSQVGKELKKYLKVPVIDVLTSGVDAATNLDANLIGVIATSGTINSNAYKMAIEAKGKVVVQKACPLFVPFIEEGELEGKLLDALIEKYLSDIKNNTEVLILGCTHYPLITKSIKNYLGEPTRILDSASLVAQDLRSLLEKKDLLNPKSKRGKYIFNLTDIDGHFVRIGKVFLGFDIQKKVKLVSLA